MRGIRVLNLLFERKYEIPIDPNTMTLKIKILNSLVGTVVEIAGIGRRYKYFIPGRFVAIKSDNDPTIIKNLLSNDLINLIAKKAKKRMETPGYITLSI